MTFTPDQSVSILKDMVVALVRKDSPDLTIRQLGVMLTCYLAPERDHTVRGLAEALGVHKPAISRALDRLAASNLTDRIADHRDARSVLVQGTAKGDSFMRDLRGIIAKAIETSEKIARVA